MPALQLRHSESTDSSSFEYRGAAGKRYRKKAAEPLPPPPPPPPEEDEYFDESLWIRKTTSFPTLERAVTLRQYRRKGHDVTNYTYDVIPDCLRSEGVTANTLIKLERSGKEGRTRVGRNESTNQEKPASDSESKLLPFTELTDEPDETRDDSDNRNEYSEVKTLQKIVEISSPELSEEISATTQSSHIDPSPLQSVPTSSVTSPATPRPTSLFKPGQPKLFYPDHRVAQYTTIYRLSDFHQGLCAGEMIPTAAVSGCGTYGASGGKVRVNDNQNGGGRSSHDRGYGTERTHRKRRPLPPRPAQPAYATTRRDVGVMTPDFEDYRMMADERSPLNFAPVSYTSTLLTTKGAVKYDSKSSTEAYSKLGRKCKLCLILVPTLIAIATTAVLILFLLGVLSTSPPTTEAKGLVTPALPGKAVVTKGQMSKPTQANGTTTATTFNHNKKEGRKSKRKPQKKLHKTAVIEVVNADVTTTQFPDSNTPYPETSRESVRQRATKTNSKGKKRKDRRKQRKKNSERKKTNSSEKTRNSRNRGNVINSTSLRIEELNRNSDLTHVRSRQLPIRNPGAEDVGEGSAYQNEEFFSDDDDIFYGFDDFMGTYFEERRRHADDDVISDDSRLSCTYVEDHVCDAVLPYIYTSYGRAQSEKQTGLTSIVLNTLSKVLASTNISNECTRNPSSLLFLCNLQFPMCSPRTGSQALIGYPCRSWCVKELSSCLPPTLLTVLNTIYRRDVIMNRNHASANLITGGRRPVRRKVERRPKLTRTSETVGRSRSIYNLEIDVIEYVCDEILSTDGSSANQEDCVDLSSKKTHQDEDRTSTESPPASTGAEPKCGVGMFSCKDEQCIDVRWRCDGYNDCGEWEDEQDCVCTYDQFRCSNRQCVEGSRACDGYYDCLDRSDELQCGTCGANLTSCGDGQQCVLNTWWCDGDVDCNNGRDEANCSCESQGMVTCGNYGNQCLPPHFLCDGEIDCLGGWDEKGCPQTDQPRCGQWEVTCDESCVSVTKLCDGNRDCNDGTDEDGCGRCEALTLQTCGQLTYNVTRMPNFLGHVTQLKTAMSPEYVMLTTIVHTRCHPLLRELGCLILAPLNQRGGCGVSSDSQTRRLPCRSLCEDVRRSCAKVLLAAALTWPRFLSCESFPTKSNETDCYHPGNGKEECSYGQFKCRNSTDGPGHLCLPMTSRCDGVTQCNDGSDEVDCNCNDLNRFRCRSGGKCLTMSHVCDGHNDCPDNSDEDSCSNCTSAQLSCYDYSCVPKSSWCDGNDDCSDGSDEMNCLKLLSPNQLGKRITEKGDNAIEKGILNRYDPITSRWLPICADSWNFLLSHQVCSQMGYSKAKSFETVIYVPTRHRKSCHVHLRNGDNQRIRRIQGALECGSQHCRSERHVQITCKPRSCGKRNDVTDGRRIYTRILGGRTSRDRTWPWVTSLTLPGMKHVCGATLVRPEWLISAAHCFQEREGLGVWKARLGTGSGGIMEFNVTDVVVHPRYNAEAVDFDIALVKLGGRVRSFNAEPLCLPTFDIDPGSYCVIAGWGVTEGLQGGTRKLQEGSVHVIERSTCQRYYPNHVISDRMMCAGRGGTVDACSGDSGGPMMCWHPQRRQWQLSGVTSWGSSCTPHSAPGVYTDVKYFSKWAERQMDELG